MPVHRSCRRRRGAIPVVAAVAAFAIAALSPVAIAQSYTVDSSASDALTSYLREHRLPLVGAQVGKESGGGRRVVLFGYVATQKGKSDAEQQARDYLGAPPPELLDHIVIEPEIAKLKNKTPPASAGAGDAGLGDANNYSTAAPVSAAGGETFDQVIQEIQRYGIKSVPDDQMGGSTP